MQPRQSEAFSWTITKILSSAQELKIRSARSNFFAAQPKCRRQAKEVMITRILKHIFVDDKDYSNFYITLLSFGFKYGIPADADLVFDVRFLPNPYYVEELKHQTGNDKPVYDYVMKSEDAGIFLKQLYDMLVFLIPRYIAEGKNQLVVAIGCTGGKHRSVTITNALYECLKDLEYSVKAEHRDVDRDSQRKGSQMR